MQSSRHRVSRLYLDADLNQDEIALPSREAHYLSHVLRLKPGEQVIVFNGRGAERRAVVKSLAKRRPELTLTEQLVPLAEPEFELTLVQALVKSDAMDLIVQKAVELGVRNIVALRTDFSVIKLDRERAARRIAHWHKIAQSACEQSGRHRPPEISIAASLREAVLPGAARRIVLQPDAPAALRDLEPRPASVCVLVGPEGGFSPADLEQIDAGGFHAVGFGPRVLRADTAAIVACAAIQLLWGDALGPSGGVR